MFAAHSLPGLPCIPRGLPLAWLLGFALSGPAMAAEGRVYLCRYSDGHIEQTSKPICHVGSRRVTTQPDSQIADPVPAVAPARPQLAAAPAEERQQICTDEQELTGDPIALGCISQEHSGIGVDKCRLPNGQLEFASKGLCPLGSKVLARTYYEYPRGYRGSSGISGGASASSSYSYSPSYSAPSRSAEERARDDLESTLRTERMRQEQQAREAKALAERNQAAHEREIRLREQQLADARDRESAMRRELEEREQAAYAERQRREREQALQQQQQQQLEQERRAREAREAEERERDARWARERAEKDRQEREARERRDREAREREARERQEREERGRVVVGGAPANDPHRKLDPPTSPGQRY